MLQDTDLMPFGKYKDQALVNVPASYFIWLRDNIKLKALNKQSLAEKKLMEYIEHNMDALEIELKVKNINRQQTTTNG